MAELRTEVRGEIAGLRTDMHRLHDRMLLQLLGAMAGLFTVFFVLSRVTA